MTRQELNTLFTTTQTTPTDFINFCLSHSVTISKSTVSKQRSGKIGIGLFAEVAYGAFFSQYQNQSTMSKNRYFRIAYTSIENSVERKPVSECDASRFKYGPPILDSDMPAGSPYVSMLQSYRGVIENLNKAHPDLYHWLDTEQPNEEGVFAY